VTDTEKRIKSAAECLDFLDGKVTGESKKKLPDAIGRDDIETKRADHAGRIRSAGEPLEIQGGKVIERPEEKTPDLISPGDAGTLVAGVRVPDVAYMAQAAAESVLLSAGLSVGSVTSEHNGDVSLGNVIDSSPLSGSFVERGTTVNLRLSLGAELVEEKPVASKKALIVGLSTIAAILLIVVLAWSFKGSENSPSATQTLVSVPDVANMTRSAAEVAIKSAGLKVGAVTERNNADVPVGSVIGQNPSSGISVASGTPVTLRLSIGPEVTSGGNTQTPQTQQAQRTVETQPARVSVPYVANMTRSAAESAIRSAGLSVSVTNENHSTVSSGNVIASNPRFGNSVAPGSTVALRVSTGPSAVTMNNRGMEYYNAKNYTEAVKWFRLAADKGHEYAKKWLRDNGYQ